MTDLVISILILAVYTLAVVGWWARRRQLDRMRAARQRVRRINAYTMSGHVVAYPKVVDLDTYSRKVNAA